MSQCGRGRGDVNSFNLLRFLRFVGVAWQARSVGVVWGGWERFVFIVCRRLAEEGEAGGKLMAKKCVKNVGIEID